MPARPRRAPFVLLVVGLLGGGLVCLLLLNTVLAQGSFQLESLRERQANLTHQLEALEQDVAYLSSPEVIARKARSLGMVPSEGAVFLDADKREVYGPPGISDSQRAGPDTGRAGR